MNHDSQPVSVTSSGGVAQLSFNRPEALNALDRDTLRTMRQAAQCAAADPGVGAILLTGNGRAFCAGADLKRIATGEMAERSESPQEAVLATASDLHHLISALARAPKPVICAVNGAAAGAGVGIALACDVVWAARSATFKLAYTAIGLGPDGGTTFFLPRLVGLKRAAELFFTNRKLTADEALDIGLVTRVEADADLLAAARTLASELARGPTRAFAEVKALLRVSGQNGLETQTEEERQAIARTFATADFAEGISAFLAKRTPVFRGV
jgi:2-(1,2-epoxy-1,2-dihydrophenyl)acetyl-CoA isomerase